MIAIRTLLNVFFTLAILASPLTAQDSGFYRLHWADKDAQMNNTSRFRVNDEDLSLHENYGKRQEALGNGLVLVNFPEDLFQVQHAELYMELWGGHPGTEEKRFSPNGKSIYPIPDEHSAANHCAYTYPSIPVQVYHLVTGINAVQLSCKKPGPAWGHFFPDEVAFRAWLKNDHADLADAGLQNFTAEVAVQNRILGDAVPLQVTMPQEFHARVKAVHYYGRYLGFDDTGDGVENDWHGYTQDRALVNHIGTAVAPPFTVTWDTRMLPTQGRPMAVRADIVFDNGIVYRTPVTDGLEFPPNRQEVCLYTCTPLPARFWSRAQRTVTAAMLLPDDLSKLEQAELWIKTWDGGAGSIKEPFTINEHAYTVATDSAPHRTIFTHTAVDIAHLRPGANEIFLQSDTEHHGIEVIYPGPALILRFKE